MYSMSFCFFVLQDRELWIAACNGNKGKVIDAIDRGADVNYSEVSIIIIIFNIINVRLYIWFIFHICLTWNHSYSSCLVYIYLLLFMLCNCKMIFITKSTCT